MHFFYIQKGDLWCLKGRKNEHGIIRTTCLDRQHKYTSLFQTQTPLSALGYFAVKSDDGGGSQEKAAAGFMDV